MGSGSEPIPPQVTELAVGADLELVWRNEGGGLTFRAGDRFIKWNLLATGIDLERERNHLSWLIGRHPVPEVIDFGQDEIGQWLVTSPLAGESAIGASWRPRAGQAIAAIADGLRAIHAVDAPDFPAAWTEASWVARTVPEAGDRPPVSTPVLVHGDACAPNTLISPNGDWVGHVDLVDLAVGDRWADLAVASMSLEWNYGAGHQDEFFDAYGIDPDPERIAYYRRLWHLES